MLMGARTSKLSRAQVKEVEEELGLFFEMKWVETWGDKDQITSLKEMEKSNFFTKELDEMLLSKEIDGAIHSAKDLPDPLPKGLKIAYLSQGLDPRDSLVIKNKPIQTVATSSQRREAAVKELFPHVQLKSIRGTIEKRLEAEVDAVVIAEAALIRLKLIHLKRIFLPGQTAALQGKIAIVCREDFIFRPSSQTRDDPLSCDLYRKMSY